MPKDVFDAMHELEFAFMLPRLEAEVTKFTSIQADKRNTYRKKVREEKKAAKDKPYTNGDSSMMSMGDEGEPAAKRARMEAGDTEDEGEGDETIEGEGDGEDEEVEDDEIEEEEEVEGLTEDPLEEREDKNEDEDMDEGDESD
jgi:DNA polymerase epsilon subunit 3